MLVSPDNFSPGDTYDQNGIQVTVIGEREPCKDRFGREMIRYWAKRSDTGAEGWIIFGPGAVEHEITNR